MSPFPKLLNRVKKPPQQIMCDWMLKAINQGKLNPQDLEKHLQKCPTCKSSLMIEEKQQAFRETTNPKRTTFDECVSDLGGVLDLSRYPYETQCMLASIKERNNTITQAINLNPIKTDPCGDIYFGLINNADLNSIAFEHKNQEYVGLYAGLMVTIDALSFCLYGCPDFLKRTAPTHTERYTTHDAKNVLQKIINPRHQSTTAVNQPKNYQRAVSSARVTYLCQTLVSFHEVGHIVGGHLMHLNRISGCEEMRFFEHSQPSYTTDRELRQALELDADAYSVGLILGIAVKSPDVFCPFEHPSLKEIATRYCLAISLLFHILDIYSVNGQLKSSSTHPVPGVRLAHSYIVARSYLDQYIPSLSNQFAEIFVKSYADVSDFWRAIGFPRRTVEIDFGKLYEAGLEIKDKQRELREEVLKDLCLQRRRKLGFKEYR